MVCFRHKAFLKSDTMIGFTRSLSLNLCITLVCFLNFYNQYFCFFFICRSEISLDVGQVERYRTLEWLTKLTIFPFVSKTSFKLSGIPLAAKASRWMLRCTQVASGATACTHVTSPLCLPVMAFAPSVQIPTHLDHQVHQVHLKPQSCPELKV